MIVNTIATKAKMIREVAEKLQQCIVKWEQSLATLRGKVETEIKVDDFAILFSKNGDKEWKLWWARGGDEWKLLTNASLKVKARAIQAMPDLIAGISDAQNVLLIQFSNTVELSDKMLSEFESQKEVLYAKQETAK